MPSFNKEVGMELQNLDVLLQFCMGFPFMKKVLLYKIFLVYCGDFSTLWIKWQSLIPGQEYIPMDQPVTAQDIQFDICRSREIPELVEFESDPAYDINGWIQKRAREF